MGIGIDKTMKAYLCILCICWGLCLAVPLSEDLEVKEEELRIVNGHESVPGERSYQASIQASFSPGSSKHFCGGTLIEKNWVVTAAHCTKTVTAPNMRVVLGATRISDSSNPVFSVKKIITADYNTTSKVNDIALLHLEENLEMQSRIDDDSNPHVAKPVKFASEDFDASSLGESCVVSGWGHTVSKGGAASERLLETAVKAVTNDGCIKMLTSRNLPYDKTGETMVCAGGKDRDACQGDSGGPLVCKVDGEDRLYGIVSWGVGCATEGIPGVYTRVGSYIDWAQERIEEETGAQLRLTD